MIGASAGGITAISKLLPLLPENPDAAFLIVLHQSPESDANLIAGIFEKKTKLKCIVPGNETPVERGCIYVSPANYHMMVKPDVILISKGPREHRYRPSIDVLFRSAAVYYGPRVIGVILTGMLDDGTSGLSAVKRCGGTAIVQDPDDAEFNQMPVTVLNRVTTDYLLPLSEMGKVIGKLLVSPLPSGTTVPQEIEFEVQMTERMMTSIDQLKQIADRSDFICPDCGGGLWKIRNDPSDRYRCHVGHVYTSDQLLKVQTQEIEESLWVCVRMLEERRNMMDNMLKDANGAERKSLAAFYEERIMETEKHISSLKRLLSDYTVTGSLRANDDKIA